MKNQWLNMLIVSFQKNNKKEAQGKVSWKKLQFKLDSIQRQFLSQNIISQSKHHPDNLNEPILAGQQIYCRESEKLVIWKIIISMFKLYDVIYFCYYNNFYNLSIEFLHYICLKILIKRKMIEIQRMRREGKKSKLLLRKKVDLPQEGGKHSCLFKQNTPEGEGCSPQPQEQDPIRIFINNVFCHRTIKSIVKKQHFIYIKLKETQNEKLYFNAHINRFKNSDSKFYQNFASYLQIFDHLMREKSTICNKQNICQMKTIFQNQLQQFLNLNKHKQLLVFYYEPSEKRLNFNQILISTKLLKNLGYDPNEFCDDFLKYKRLFFEIFQTSLFQKAIRILAKQYHQFAEENGQIQNMKPNDICKLMKEKIKKKVVFEDCVFMREKDAQGIIQKKLPAKFSYFKFQANITSVQILSFDETKVIESHRKTMSHVEQKLKKIEQDKVSQEIEEMKKLMHRSFFQEDGKPVKQAVIEMLG